MAISKLKPAFFIILALAVTGFAFYYIFVDTTYIVQLGNIEEKFVSDAVILKNETAVVSPTSGRLQLLVEHGERVRVGTPLFMVCTDVKQRGQYEEQIRELEEKIKALEEKTGNPSIPLNLLDKSIESTTKKLQDAIDKGEFDQIKVIKDELSDLKDEKQKKVEASQSNRDILKRNLEELKKQLKEVELIVYAPVAGIVSFNLDGLESILAPDKAESLSFKELQNIKREPKKKNLPTNINANQTVLKLIDNFSWYIALDTKKELKEGRYYYICIEGVDEKVKAKLIDVHGDVPVGVFSINQDLQSLIDSRKIEVEVMVRTHTGHLVPNRAIFSKDQEEGAYVLEKGRKKFKAVEIVAQNETDAIVEGLKLGDKILLNKRGIR